MKPNYDHEAAYERGRLAQLENFGVRATHTPGPWKAFHVGNTIGIVPVDSRGQPRGGRNTEDVCALNKDGDCADGNAALLASSPDLLQACRDALRVIDECIPVTATVPVPGISVQLRAAIAKATA